MRNCSADEVIIFEYERDTDGQMIQNIVQPDGGRVISLSRAAVRFLEFHSGISQQHKCFPYIQILDLRFSL